MPFRQPYTDPTYAKDTKTGNSLGVYSDGADPYKVIQHNDPYMTIEVPEQVEYNTDPDKTSVRADALDEVKWLGPLPPHTTWETIQVDTGASNIYDYFETTASLTFYPSGWYRIKVAPRDQENMVAKVYDIWAYPVAGTEELVEPPIEEVEGE